jgi:hypothetical protein
MLGKQDQLHRIGLGHHSFWAVERIAAIVLASKRLFIGLDF